MEGGIQAWHGLVADGAPEAGISYFEVGTTAADMAALAWMLEENTRLFYTGLIGMRPGTSEASLFGKLVEAEEHHKTTLSDVHRKFSSEPIERFRLQQVHPVIEGGVLMEEVLSWAQDKPLRKILAYAMGFEANAYDRYLKMFDIAEGEEAKAVFKAIAMEEKGHLRRLGELLDTEVN